jgi:hypothetical protein
MVITELQRDASRLGRLFHFQDVRGANSVRLLNEGVFAGLQSLEDNRQPIFEPRTDVDGLYISIVQEILVRPVLVRHAEFLRH